MVPIGFGTFLFDEQATKNKKISEGIMFKIGDLVKLDATYHPERHPPMGTIGIVTHIEDWGDINPCGDDVEQFVRVHWAGEAASHLLSPCGREVHAPLLVHGKHPVATLPVE